MKDYRLYWIWLAESAGYASKTAVRLINIFGNAGIPYTTYDTICTLEEVCLFDRWSIPVTVCKTVYREYTVETIKITAEAAAENAMKTLREKRSDAIGNGELLSQSITTTLTESVYRIDCLLYCLKDIGTTVEFHAETLSGQKDSQGEKQD